MSHEHIKGCLPGLSSSVINSVVDRLTKDEVYSVSDESSFTLFLRVDQALLSVRA